MLTLITGVPGAGKTLYALEKLVLPLVGTTVRQRLEDGTEVEHPRVIYTNIKGLQVEHELTETGAIWEFAREGGWKQAADGNRLGFHNWHEWAKPGAVLVPDEFQKIWPPRANGAPVPPDVQAMDTHRHMGVDFVLITQNCNNVDRHLLGLVGRHLHVRRIANLPLAVVYEWDHCSRSLMYSKSISKSPWRYDRKIYKLYHSADLHTKQPRKVPTLVFVVLAALGLAAWKIPESYSRIADKGNQHEQRMAALQGGQKPAGGSGVVAPAAGPQNGLQAVSGPVPGLEVPEVPQRAFAGCAVVRNACQCYDDAGKPAAVDLETCVAEFPRLADRQLGFLPRDGVRLAGSGRPAPAAADPARDGELIRTVNGRRSLSALTD